MKKYVVYLPVQGSVSVDVVANNPDEAMRKGISKIESMSHDEICRNIEYGHYEVEEVYGNE